MTTNPTHPTYKKMDIEELQEKLEQVTKERDRWKSQARETEERDRIISEIQAMGASGDNASNLYYVLKGQGKIKYDAESDSIIGQLSDDGSPCPVDTLLRITKSEKPSYFSGDKPKASRDNGYEAPQPKKNPFSDKNFNLTEITRLYRENPELARKLEADAG